MNAQIKVKSENPLQVWISKNGRPVGKVGALSALKKRFPDIEPDQWEFGSTDHSTLAWLKP